VSNNYLPYLEDRLNIRGGVNEQGMEKSEDFTSTLYTSFVPHKESMSKSEMYEKRDGV
jgi:hypothetical protein